MPRIDQQKGIWLWCIGVDPGQSGGVAFIGPGGVKAVKMPATERDICDLFREDEIDGGTGIGTEVRRPAVAVIEKVHSMPGQGVSSTFKFGAGYGGLRMALIAAGIPFDEVTPQAWQKALDIPKRGKTESKTQFKNRLKAKAQQMFPSVIVTLATADALLIAEYCHREHGGIS